MRGSVRAPRFFSVPSRPVAAISRDLSPLLQAHRSSRHQGETDPIHDERAIPMGCLWVVRAVAEY
jgi:hypothetical protein